jgi:hypothetical protein
MSKPRRVLPLPCKRLLNVDEAAEYCGIGRVSFLSNCPVRAKRIRPGQRGLRYDVRDLDEWIDTLGAAGRMLAWPNGTPEMLTLSASWSA